MNGTKINLTYDDLKEFVRITSSFESDIDIVKRRYVIDAKSLMGILSLDFSKDISIVIHSENKDEIARFNETMKKFQ